MTNRELRLECVRIASDNLVPIQRTPANVLAAAAQVFEFVTSPEVGASQTWRSNTQEPF